MKKILYAGMAAILALLPQVVKAQDAEAPNPDALEAKDNQPGKKDAAADKNADKNANKAGQFAERQKTINGIMEKLKKATRNSDKRKYREQLTREQRAYQREVNHAREPLETQIKKLKAQLKYPAVNKQKLEKELAEQEQKLQTVNKEADLEKWCVKPETLTNDSPDPGPGKKASKNKKTKKIRRSKKSKG